MIVSPAGLVRAIRQLNADEKAKVANARVRLYVDTLDMRKVVEGAHGFYDHVGTFVPGEFASLRALARGIIWMGALGSVRLTAPHQAELLSHLQYSFHRDHTITDAERVSALLLEISAMQPHDVDERLSIAIKAVASVNLPWQQRLNELVSAGTLDMDTIRDDYTKIVRTKEFREIYKVFDHFRSGKESNNFADAAALTTIITAARSYQRGETDELPRFYASSALFDTVLQRTKYREELLIPIGDTKIDLVVDSAYIIVRALFAADTPHWDPNFAEAIQEVITALVEGPIEPGVHTLKLLDTFRDTLATLTTKLLFYRVWIPAASAITDSTSISLADLAPPSSQAQLARDIRAIATRLRQNTEDFRRLRDIWVSANDAFADFAKRQWPKNPTHVEGLVRFAFPPRVMPAITAAIEALRSGDQNPVDEVSVLVARIVKKPEPERVEFFSVAALLWVLQLYDRLRNLVGGHSNLHPALSMLAAAACLRIDGAEEEASEITAGLVGAWKSATTAERARLGTGIAFLEFRLAQHDGFVPSWQRENDELHLAGDGGVDRIERAIDYARESASYSQLEDNQRAYAANQCLYYLVALGTAPDAILQGAASRLSTFKYNHTVWQYRFDDTVARYFFLRARRERDPTVAAQFRRFAMDASEQAIAEAPDDPEVRAFNDQLRVAIGTQVVTRIAEQS